MDGIFTKASVGDGIGVSGWPFPICSDRWPLDKWSEGPWRTACCIEVELFPDSFNVVDVEVASVLEDSDEAPAIISKQLLLMKHCSS